MTYLPPQAFPPCPNDSLRKENPAALRIEYSSANLPDCRAYEQATPVDKDGGDAGGTAPFVRASLSGGAVSFLSVSGIPGGKGSQDFPPYLASRGGAWSTHGLLPPASTGQQAAVVGWTPDFSRVYTKATELGEPPRTTFMVSPGAGGETRTIAPYTNELSPAYAGASDGGAEAIFESRAAIVGVPGAIAGRSNVYLWDEASEELSLAGVMNDGQAPPAGAFAGSYDWINGTDPATLIKGGAARRYYTQDQRAISDDGSAVYFTAGGNGRLYARLNPTEAQSALNGEGNCTQSALACTVQVNSSQKKNGTGPNGTDPASAAPAAFMGASADGSKALFTSSEMLTDDANTGPEQKPATIESADRDGTDIVPSLVPTHATAVAVDAEHIYWINPQTAAIGRANLDGTDAQSEFISVPQLEPESGVLLPAKPRGLAVDGGEIYWTNGTTEVDKEGVTKFFEGTIGRAKLNGEGAATEIEPNFIEGAGNAHAVAVDALHLFWTNDALPGVQGAGAVGRATIGGNEIDSEFFSIPGNGRTELPGMAVDGEHIYWIENNNDGFSRISRAKLDGGNYEVTFIFLGQFVEGKGLAVKNNEIYWSTRDLEAIGRAQLNGEGAASKEEPELIKAANHPLGLALDATHVYWGANGESLPNPGNDLYLYDTATNSLSDLAPDSTATAGTDVRGVLGASEDASYAYFVANGVPDGVAGSPNAGGEVAKGGTCTGVIGFAASGTCNLYLAHGTEVKFIAQVDVAGGENSDAANWAATPNGIIPNSVFQKTARVTPDGKALLFRSQRQLTDYRNEGTPQFYLYRVGEDRVSCVSCNPTGEAPSSFGKASLGAITTPSVFPTPPASLLSHNLSSDGNRIFFETTDALLGADTNDDAGCRLAGSPGQGFPACTDVYEWEAKGVGTCDAAHAVADGGCFYLISTGKGTEPALIADASGDGKEVFFFSRSKLVGQDEDGLLDVYDARVDGGLQAQNGPPLTPCESAGSCHPLGPLPPEIAPPPKVASLGNPKNKKPPCANEKHRVKGRCVAKHKMAKKHHKGAKNKGRAER
jgi:hypothetical protein